MGTQVKNDYSIIKSIQKLNEKVLTINEILDLSYKTFKSMGKRDNLRSKRETKVH